ncbi:MULTISPECIES: diguanylate cyclase domain-containing protein [Paenibacillus]|uniref:diguanylate cyclase domain-containing protein n=1 Tax=Paenibacillus TaxID=44249 RepID=UPI002FE2ED44
MAVMYIDLDGFKAVNDSLGHQVGDLLLQKVAQRLESVTVPGGLAARLGGNEFLLLMPTSADDKAARKEVESLARGSLIL